MRSNVRNYQICQTYACITDHSDGKHIYQHRVMYTACMYAFVSLQCTLECFSSSTAASMTPGRVRAYQQQSADC